MQKFFRLPAFILAAIVGFILLVPLIILELVNRWRYNEGFPFSVFIFTWLLQTLFVLILAPMIKTIHSRKPAGHALIFVLQVVGLILIAYIWGSWILDQWPCLMGVPNCD